MKRALILGLGALLVTAAIAAAQGKPVAAPKTSGQATVGANFIDANGDAICDNFQNGTRDANGQGQGKCCGRGKGNGMHVGPQDGTGFGAPAGAGTGTGICDGTGPKGRGRGPRR
jgi:hypothetical protein